MGHFYLFFGLETLGPMKKSKRKKWASLAFGPTEMLGFGHKDHDKTQKKKKSNPYTKTQQNNITHFTNYFLKPRKKKRKEQAR